MLYCLRDGVGIYSLCQAFNDFGTFFNSNYPAVQRDMIVGGIAPLHIGMSVSMRDSRALAAAGLSASMENVMYLCFTL